MPPLHFKLVFAVMNSYNKVSECSLESARCRLSVEVIFIAPPFTRMVESIAKVKWTIFPHLVGGRFFPEVTLRQRRGHSQTRGLAGRVFYGSWMALFGPLFNHPSAIQEPSSSYLGAISVHRDGSWMAPGWLLDS